MAYSYLGLDYTPADLFQMWNGKSKNGGKNGSTIPGRVPESKGSKIQAPVGVKHVSGKNKSFTEMFNDYKNSAESGEYEYSPIIIQIRDKHKLDDGGTYSHYVMVIDKVEGKGNEYVIVDPYSTNKSKITKTVTIDDYGDSYTVSSKDYQKNIHHTNTSDNLKQYYRPKENDICFKQLYEMQ